MQGWARRKVGSLVSVGRREPRRPETMVCRPWRRHALLDACAPKALILSTLVQRRLLIEALAGAVAGVQCGRKVFPVSSRVLRRERIRGQPSAFCAYAGSFSAQLSFVTTTLTASDSGVSSMLT